MVNEEKREKFISLAEPRVQNVIHSIEIIMPMANGNNYDYLEGDVDLMISAIREKVDNLEDALKDRFLKNQLAEKKSFSFRVEKIEKEQETKEKQILE